MKHRMETVFAKFNLYVKEFRKELKRREYARGFRRRRDEAQGEAPKGGVQDAGLRLNFD